MADLDIECFITTNNDGNYNVQDGYLGRVTISTLSTTSQSATLKPGTRYVKLATDAVAQVHFAFGQGSVTATTDDQTIRPDLDETVLFSGINKKENDTIAARLEA